MFSLVFPCFAPDTSYIKPQGLDVRSLDYARDDKRLITFAGDVAGWGGLLGGVVASIGRSAWVSSIG